jgi:hypothetical protein
MKKKYLFLLAPLLLFVACNNQQADTKNDLSRQEKWKDADYAINMHFGKRAWTEKADTIFLRFRITDINSNRKVIWPNLENDKFVVIEEDYVWPNKDIIVERIVQKVGSEAELISQNVAFWLMVDRGRTISDEDMKSMKAAIQKTVENLPDSCAYISFFDRRTSEKKLITKENFYEFEKEFKVKPEPRDLYQCIMDNFEKFAKDTSMQKKSASPLAKYLLVFTDGNININSFTEIDNLDRSDEYIKNIDNTFQNHVQIHAFRYGSGSSLVDKVLDNICVQRQFPELRGGFYPATNVNGIIDSLRGFVNNLSADYRLKLINHNKNRIYNGKTFTLNVGIADEGRKAVGKIDYVIASKESPKGPGIRADNIYLTIIFGLIILFIAFFIMQVIIPFIISKSNNFEKKYVRPYEPMSTSDGEVYETCSYCQEPLERGEQIVVKCSHKIHWDCWKENGYKCVEYGQNCKDGVQYHFDKKHPFDLKKSPYYLKWAMSGMISGFFIWIIFKISSEWTIFSGFINLLVNTFYPAKLKEAIEGATVISNNVYKSFNAKITGLLLAGILLGFVLTFLFTYINDFRQKSGKVIFAFFGRALIGAIVGYITFLLGSIICILLGKVDNTWWLDAIPWILFGGSIALCLAIKSTIKWQDALIGGLISGVISFIILYTTFYFPVFGVMFSFMLCSAGLGISIIARHHLAQKYFLKYKGEKRESEIAIHKWMNESGGSNEVTIGKSNHCVIQMNWDSSEKIHDKQVKLFIDPKRRVPMMKALENGVVFDGREAHKDDLLPLKHGVKFTIGNTKFQYIEK